MQHHIIKSLAALALGAMLLTGCSKEESNEVPVNPTPGQETVSFVGTRWEAHLDFNDIVAGSERHFVYDMTMEFFTDSTGRTMLTMLEPYSIDPTPFDFVYQFDGVTSGSLTEFNMYGEQLETLRITYAKQNETITISNDDYTPEQHAKFDRVFHQVNNNATDTNETFFSVAADRQVRISRGNLQYQASTGTWRFAERQYEVIGTANTRISPSNEGWIDCFGWGTSGWESGANAYQPWSVSVDDADYQPGGSWQNGLTGDYANADWGVYNAISNGGNQAGMWRTLTNVEWAYLFGGGNRPSKWGRAIIDGHYKGIILLPDEWTDPEGISFTPAHNGFNSNTYTLEQWERLEAAGAIFLPAAGYRQYTFYNYANQYGVYWSVSPYGAEYPDCALGLLFNDNMLYPSDGEGRSNGFSVRLVQDS